MMGKFLMQNSKGTEIRNREKVIGYSYSLQQVFQPNASTLLQTKFRNLLHVIIGVIEPKRALAPHCRELNVCACTFWYCSNSNGPFQNCARSVASAEHAAFANQPHPLRELNNNPTMHCICLVLCQGGKNKWTGRGAGFCGSKGDRCTEKLAWSFVTGQ